MKAIKIYADLKGESDEIIAEFNSIMIELIEKYIKTFKQLPQTGSAIVWSNGIFDPCYISEILIGSEEIVFFLDWQ